MDDGADPSAFPTDSIGDGRDRHDPVACRERDNCDELVRRRSTRGAVIGAVFAENGFVDANPETGPLRHRQCPLLQNKFFAQELVAQRVMRAVEFDDRLVLQRDRICGMRRWRDRGQRMQRGGVSTLKARRRAKVRSPKTLAARTCDDRAEQTVERIGWLRRANRARP